MTSNKETLQNLWRQRVTVHSWPTTAFTARFNKFPTSTSSYTHVTNHLKTCPSGNNCWFSHDVTKIQTTKLSILLRLYFHYVLEQLKTNFHTNFRFKRALGFVIEYAWISKLLRDVAFTWRPRELSCRIEKVTYFGEFFYLNSSCIRKSITFMFMSSSRNKFTLLYQNSVTDVFVGFRPPCWCPSRWVPAWRLHTNLYKFE